MENEKKRFVYALYVPVIFIILLWLIRIAETITGADFTRFGILPLRPEGLPGIITAPLIHGSFSHLMANTIPLLILSTGIIYIYKDIAYKVLMFIYLLTGIWVWLFARGAYHIGASGLVYGCASFLFFSGVIRKDPRMAALSFVVVFLYGSMIWGIFPIEPHISWESHLMGAVAGGVMAVYYRKEGPKQIKYQWEDDDDDNDDSPGEQDQQGIDNINSTWKSTDIRYEVTQPQGDEMTER
ncbi:MAG: rhomboid family intramembrane serine protease [Bacteroidia bacterium]|nr:rhomboid family intramembrane serine protease [Bacteroidia bacterium]